MVWIRCATFLNLEDKTNLEMHRIYDSVLKTTRCYFNRVLHDYFQEFQQQIFSYSLKQRTRDLCINQKAVAGFSNGR